MKTMKRKMTSLGLAFIMALTIVFSNVGMVAVKAADESPLTFAARWCTDELIQVNTNLPSDTPLVSFTLNENNCSVTESGDLKAGWVGMDNADGTIVLTFHFNAKVNAGQTYTIEKDSVFGFNGGNDMYKLTETCALTWDGATWTVANPTQGVEKDVTFTYRWGSESLIQVNTDLPSDMPLNNFLTDAAGCDIKAVGSHTIGWIGMDKVEDTIVLTFNFNANDTFAKDDTFTLEAGSKFKFTGSDDTYVLKESCSLTFNGTDFAAPAPVQGEDKDVNFTYRWGNESLIQVNTDLPSDLPLNNFLTDAEGCDIKAVGSHTIGWIGMDKVEDTIVLTFNFNANDTFAKDDTFTLEAGSKFKFTGSNDTYILKELCSLTFNGTDFAKPASHECTYETKIVKATTTKAGSIKEVCTDCGNEKSTTVIPAASRISLNKTSLTYNKKTQKVTVMVKDSKGKAIKTSEYKVTGTASAKAVGTYKVTVTFKGNNYTGSKTLTWKLNPATTKVTNVKAAKKSLTVTWKKQTAETKGYKIQVSTDKNFKKNVKTVTINKNKTTSKKITGLKTNKKYYVRICTYKGNNTSAWTKYAKNVKVK